MESRKFEDAFQNAFKEAEVSPSDAVWTNVELDLERAEGGKMKRRILFYKLLAAASVAFAMSVAGIGYYLVSDPQYVQQFGKGSMASENTSSPDPSKNSTAQTQAEATTENTTHTTAPLADAGTTNAASVEAASPNANAANAATAPDRIADNTHAASLPAIAETSAKGSPAQAEPATDKISNAQGGQPANGNTVASTGAAGSTAVANPATSASNGNANATENKNTQRPGPKAPDATVATVVAANGHEPSRAPSDAARAHQPNASSVGVTSADRTADRQAFAVAAAANGSDALRDGAGTAPRKLPARVSKPESMVIAPPAQEFQPDPVQRMMAALDAQERAMREEEKKEKQSHSEKLWTSVGFAAGGFNTVTSNVASSPSVALNNVADQQAKASGTAYTVGVSLGTRLSNRWVLQGGVNYMTQASDYTANAIGTQDYQNFTAPSMNTKGQETMMSSAPYNVNNNLQFISVPLQAGYLVVNKKFGVQINGGISTDLFLQNTITPESESLQKTTQGRGADSPYRSVNFSGLLGTELSYRLGQHYRVALNPGLRYPLNSIYKDDQPVEAIPLTFDLGLRFRYIFH